MFWNKPSIFRAVCLFTALVFGVYSHALQAGRLEAGDFRTTSTTGGSATRVPTPVTFRNTFDTVPIVVAISDERGNQSASIRITDITTTGFNAVVLEPDNWDGGHLDQPIMYIAVESGRHVLPDNSIIEAGRSNIANVQLGPGVAGTASWANVSYSGPLGNSVSVLSQIQTANSETANPPSIPSRPHITSIVQNANSSGFQLALDRSQALTGNAPVTETVGWIAMTAAGNGSFPDINGNNINWASRVSGFSVRGWDDGCFTQNFGLSSGTRIVVAKKTSRRNADGGWLRHCSLGATTIGLRVDEDTDQDGERSVPAGSAEQASMIAFSQAFHANLRPAISVTKISQNFASDVDGDGNIDNGFALPRASLDYQILVTNSGNAPPNEDSVTITEQLPANVELRVSDFGAPGSGPIEFSDGTPTSQLTSSIFNSLGSTIDAVSFSTDGVNFNYTPTPDVDGYDDAVTHFRVQPEGFFAGNQGSGDPNFTLRFTVRIR